MLVSMAALLSYGMLTALYNAATLILFVNGWGINMDDITLFNKYSDYVAAGDRWALVAWLDTLAAGLEDRLLLIIEQKKA